MLRADRIVLDICYPDGRMKSAGWGGMWITNTDALIFSEKVMTPEQKKLFRGSRRWRKPAWRNRPTLIRATRIRTDEPICSAGEFQASEGHRSCERRESDARDRGVVRKVTLRISVDGKEYNAVIDEDLMSGTSELILNERAMADKEKGLKGQETAIAIRRLLPSANGTANEPELVFYNSSAGTMQINSASDCGSGESLNRGVL